MNQMYGMRSPQDPGLTTNPDQVNHPLPYQCNKYLSNINQVNPSSPALQLCKHWTIWMESTINKWNKSVRSLIWACRTWSSCGDACYSGHLSYSHTCGSKSISAVCHTRCASDTLSCSSTCSPGCSCDTPRASPGPSSTEYHRSASTIRSSRSGSWSSVPIPFHRHPFRTGTCGSPPHCPAESSWTPSVPCSVGGAAFAGAPPRSSPSPCSSSTSSERIVPLTWSTLSATRSGSCKRAHSSHPCPQSPGRVPFWFAPGSCSRSHVH